MMKIGLGININIMVKREVLDGPLGIILRPIGLIPINRSAALNVVDQMVQRFGEYEQMWLGITPEGTRKRVTQWKSGFLRIARDAKVPIQTLFIDYPDQDLHVRAAGARQRRSRCRHERHPRAVPALSRQASQHRITPSIHREQSWIHLASQHYDAFLLACIALNLTPGLDTFYILTRSGREGHAVGLAAAFGINAGCLVHTAAAVLGISAILMTSAIAFSVLKYLGAAYLVWIGLHMLLSAPRHAAAYGNAWTRSGCRVPARYADQRAQSKVALFYLAFLPQFVSMHAAHPQLGLILLGLSFIGTGMTWSAALALLGGRIHRLLLAKPRLGQWMDRLCGTVLLGFGVKLALQQRS